MMNHYKPEKLAAVSRYQNYFPTMPTAVQRDTYARMLELLEEETDAGNGWERSRSI